MFKDNQAIEALEWFIDMKDDDLEKFEKLPEYFQVNIGRLVFYAREFIKENMTYPQSLSSTGELEGFIHRNDNWDISGSSPLGTTTQGEKP
jgi:hypothetical protein